MYYYSISKWLFSTQYCAKILAQYFGTKYKMYFYNKTLIKKEMSIQYNHTDKIACIPSFLSKET